MEDESASINNATRNAVNRTQAHTYVLRRQGQLESGQLVKWPISQLNQLINFNIPFLLTFWPRRKLDLLPKQTRNSPQKHTKSIPDISTRKNRDRIRLPWTVPKPTRVSTRQPKFHA